MKVAETMASPDRDEFANLSQLDGKQLAEVMYERLRGNPSVGPVVDSRVGPEPFEWLSEQFRRGDAGLQHRMTALLGDFLEQLPDTVRWPQEARYALLDLIQDCGESLVDQLLRLIRQQTLLHAQGLGPDVHAALLKCLISNGHHATPTFWLQQLDILGPEYGALIFSGLIDHGLELAFAQLPLLCKNEEAGNYVRWLFPHLQDRFGTSAVLDQLDRVRDQLPDEVYHLYRQDLLSTIAANVPSPSVAAPGDPGSATPVNRDPPPISKTSANREQPQPPSWLLETVDRARSFRVDSPHPFAGIFAEEAA